ncbi:VOC family protein [Deinococcus sp. HMF7604]|uniref:VOC family protein n=1 Tax=Deinococcus betulae TaxID=2873312 RepID=UPI001CCC00B8|nr:VOC family protein [Deinococcus betulae]MBZ9750552.1 VOC family protein [Deinococcus betulae]
MIRIGSVVWGVRDVARAVAFWTAALHYRPREAPSDDWSVLVPEHGEGVQLALKLVTSEAQTHRRHHLDLYADDQGAEVERLLALGAQRVDWRYEPGADYVVLADPDGNRFCVVQK